MSYWDLKLALTCLLVGLATFFLFGSAPDKWEHFKANVGVLCLAAWLTLFLLLLWCIWNPPEWLGKPEPAPTQHIEWSH